MGKVRVAGFSVSLDGFGAGVGQSQEKPIGERGFDLFQWYFVTRAFREMHGEDGGEVGVDHGWAARAMSGFGAFILGRNMFGPVRGGWGDQSWKGWWGENPPYHAPTFVLTHHARKPLVMEGGTTFYFVTDGIESALRQAREAAGEKDVKIGGGVSTVRQYLEIGAIDEMHLVMTPAVLGRGEALLTGIDLAAKGFSVKARAFGERAMHVVMGK